jgi:hypothetical protein
VNHGTQSKIQAVVSVVPTVLIDMTRKESKVPMTL